MSRVKALPLWTLCLVCSGLSILIVPPILFLHYSKILIILSLPVSTALHCTRALWGIVIAEVKLGRQLLQPQTGAAVEISCNVFCFDWLLLSLFGCAHIAIRCCFYIWVAYYILNQNCRMERIYAVIVMLWVLSVGLQEMRFWNKNLDPLKKKKIRKRRRKF